MDAGKGCQFTGIAGYPAGNMGSKPRGEYVIGQFCLENGGLMFSDE